MSIEEWAKIAGVVAETRGELDNKEPPKDFQVSTIDTACSRCSKAWPPDR